MTAADGVVKHVTMQLAMNTHLSQSPGIGALAGQHGMSPAISAAMACVDMSCIDMSCADMSSAIDISEAIAIDASGVVPAMTGRENGANTSPTIIEIASRRRMVI